MAKQNITGAGGAFALASSACNFTKWTWKGTKKLGDTTDSEDFDSATNLVYNSQVGASFKAEVSVEGKWDVNGSQDPILESLLDGVTGALDVDLDISSTEPFGFGDFDVQDFEAEVPVEDAVTFKCTLVSNGLFTLGARP